MSAPRPGSASADGSPVLTGPYCGQCGEPLAGAEHGRCAALSALEPPRFCATCRRRMLVQVVPRGWTARCSRHGEATSITVVST